MSSGLRVLLFAAIGMGMAVGACSIRDAFAQADPAPWRLRAPVGQDAREVPILVSEENCASGDRADGRIRATVEETDDTVTITVRVRKLSGMQECPGNPMTPFTIELESELAGRSLVDGFTGELREIPILTPVALGTPAADVDPVPPASRSRSRSGSLPGLDCGAANLPPEAARASWMSDLEIVPNEPDLLLGYAVHRFGLKPTGWHQFTSLEPFGRSSYVWFQYLNGVPVGTFTAQTVLIGHSLLAHTCGGGDWVPDQVVPDNGPFERIELAPKLDLDGILAGTSGFVPSDDGISFADPSNRCRTWVAFEDNLETAGLTAYPTVGYVEMPPFDESIETQIIALVSDGAGRAALVSTAPGGLVTIGPAPKSSLTEDPPRFSWLQSCLLDTTSEFEVQALD